MADAPLFKVPVADLEYGEKDLEEPIPEAWLRSALEGTEAVPNGPGELELTVSKSGREVMARGRARAHVTMPCARTLDPVPYDLDVDIFLLLAPAAAAPVVRPLKAKAKRAATDPAKSTGKGPHAKPGTAVKSAKRSKSRDKEEDALLTEDDAARDTYDGETVVLDPFIKEFLVLELPMFPLREDLRSEDTPAIERPPEPAEPRPREALDPRLAPLADIAKRLREKKE